MSFYCTAENCPVREIFGTEDVVRCTAKDCKDRTETPSCSTCKWHDGFSWVCFNGLSEHRADFTDPEDCCEKWEKRENE